MNMQKYTFTSIDNDFIKPMKKYTTADLNVNPWNITDLLSKI